MSEWELVAVSYETIKGLGFDFRSNTGKRWRQNFMPEAGMDIGLLISDIRNFADSIEIKCFGSKEDKEAIAQEVKPETKESRAEWRKKNREKQDDLLFNALNREGS